MPAVLNDVPDSLLGTLKERKLAILCGSAISLFPPSSLPSGQAITKAVLQALHRESSFGAGAGAGYRIEPSPFLIMGMEHVFEVYLELIGDARPREERVRHFLTVLLGSRTPNRIHVLFSDLLACDKVPVILTTNFDHLIEEAGQGRVWALWQEEQKPISGRPFLFKLHGDLSDGSMIYAVRQEARGLAQWKSNLLSKVFTPAPHLMTLLVVGYSGWDYDICAELATLPLRTIYWCAYDRPPDVDILIDRFDGTILELDLRQLCASLAGAVGLPFQQVSPAGFAHDLQLRSAFREVFSDREENECWYHRLLTTAGLGRDVLLLASPRRETLSLHAVRLGVELARAHFLVGMYGAAARHYERAAESAQQLALRGLTAQEDADALRLEEAECRRLQGRLLKALSLIKTVAGHARQEMLLFRIAERRAQIAHVLLQQLEKMGKLFHTSVGTLRDYAIRGYRLAEIGYKELGSLRNMRDVQSRLGKLEALSQEPLVEYRRLSYGPGFVNELREAAIREPNLEERSRLLRMSALLAEYYGDYRGMRKAYRMLAALSPMEYFRRAGEASRKATSGLCESVTLAGGIEMALLFVRVLLARGKVDGVLGPLWVGRHRNRPQGHDESTTERR